ncbi:acyltransferase family protein [Brevibacillus sp. GCM10020057]|uniref:acyltransferase family protein n=1 Tax=Brevibacillus sp. GCM10020057 TaxID=3317327 RepID=UPI0036317BD9
MPEPWKGTSRYMAGIDGLRALAVLAVILYHLNYNWAPGGLLGVGIFFVLSGYLITDLLIAQWSRHKRLDMKDFWLRRARRLLPALLLLLVLVTAWVVCFKPEHLPSMKGDVPAAILYVSNWWLIFQDVSYFEKFGPASPFGHLWSLSVEEQFYLVWPLLLALGLRYVKRRIPLVCLTLFAAALSAGAMAWLYDPDFDPSRVYYGTDTRVFALLIGAALAMVWPSRKLSAAVSRRARLSIDVTGGIGLAILLFAIWKSNQYDEFLYRGGLVFLSITSAVVVAAMAHPASLLARWMGCKPLKWLGVRSYGIYLWHYPIIILTSPGVEQTDAYAIPRAILQVLACIVAAAVSWKYIEEPIRHGALGRIWPGLRRQQDGRKGRYTRWIASACAVWLCATYFGVASLTSDATARQTPAASQTEAAAKQPRADSHPPQQKQVGPAAPVHAESGLEQPTEKAGKAPQKPQRASKPEPQNQQPAATGRAGQGPAQPEPQKPDASGLNQQQTEQPAGKPKESVGTAAEVDAKQTPIASGKGVTAVGDSVMLDIAPYLEQLLPGVVIDGKIGRQMSQAPDVIASLKAQGKLGDIVIIELGTNGAFREKQLAKLMQTLAGTEQIILVNTRVPKPWESVVNSVLAEAAAANPQVTLVDWYTASAGKDNFFYQDGVHLNPEGSAVYAKLVAEAVAKAAGEKKQQE